MAKKRYISLTGIQYTFPVEAGGKYVWISFKGNENEYSTSRKDVQEAIESFRKFKNGEIGLVKEGVTENAPPAVLEAVEFPDVTTINDAVAVLKKAPYSVHHTKLKTPDDVINQARDRGVGFPNLAI